MRLSKWEGHCVGPRYGALGTWVVHDSRDRPRYSGMEGRYDFQMTVSVQIRK